MKVIFSHDLNQIEDNVVLVQDIKIVDILVEDSEATEIIVDDFLSGYNYNEAGQVLNKIISKLRINGKILISFLDPLLMSYNLSTDLISIEDFNQKVFYKPRKSFLSSSIIKDLLRQSNIKINTIKNLDSFGKIIIIGERNV